MNDKYNNAVDFLIYSCLGDISDPIMTSIDRAYVDMAAHTVKGFENDNEKFNFRMNASKIIKKQINEYNAKKIGYDEWHKSLCKKILELNPKGNITFGQAQKWVNMAMKYLYVLFILGKLDSHKELHRMIEDNYQYFHIPLDNIIFKEIYDEFDDLKESSCSLVGKTYNPRGYNGDYPWSKIGSDKVGEYYEFQKEITNGIKETKIDWENEHWIKKSKELSQKNPNKYKKYYKEHNPHC